MAVAIDEWGSWEGLFTLGCIVEEIIGGIREGFDDEEPVVKEREDGTYHMGARIPIGEVNETLGADFEGKTLKPSAASCSASWATYRRSGMRSPSAATSSAWTMETVPGSWVAQIVFRLADEEQEGETQACSEPGGGIMQ